MQAQFKGNESKYKAQSCILHLHKNISEFTYLLQSYVIKIYEKEKIRP